MDPHKLACTLTKLSIPESPSAPCRNRRSLFIPKERSSCSPFLSTPADNQEAPTYAANQLDFKQPKSAGRRHSSVPSSPISIPGTMRLTTDREATSSLIAGLDDTSLCNKGNHGYVPRTPPQKRPYSKSSWYMYTDPRQKKTSSIVFHPNKKRRVSFKPSLEVTEYYSGGPNDPYSLPLNDASAADTSVRPVADDSLDQDVLAPDEERRNSRVMDTSHLSRRGHSEYELEQPSHVQSSVLLEVSKNPPVELNTTYDRDDNIVADSSLEIPRQLKNYLANLVADNQCSTDPNKSVIAQYAPLHTSTSLSPVKHKLSFPPLSLDPLHSSLKYKSKRGSKSALPMKFSIERENAIIPTSFFKTWYYKCANNKFLPASTTTWLQDYSTSVIEHLVKMMRARCLRNTGRENEICTASVHDAVAVMREYLEFDDSVDINNLIHTYLPMELWFTYDSTFI